MSVDLLIFSADTWLIFLFFFLYCIIYYLFKEAYQRWS